MNAITLHHILLKSPLLAQDILRELSLGAEFSDLAEEYSACPSSRNQGFAGYHDRDELPWEIVQALSEWNEQDAFIGPVKTRLGYHIIKPTERLSRPLLNDESNTVDKL
ncbi:MAG: peptidylprolyl isomerase [Bacterioplanes sp.]|nr:peptidylprolyl isomerase [Bacterioplanes sp.]